MAAKQRSPTGGGDAGMAVDASGNVAYDPSQNVLALVAAAVQRLDDMNGLRDRISELRAEHGRELNAVTATIAELREAHSTEIRRLESDRLDKIRAVDVANAAATAQQLLSAVQTLASTAQATAETLRNQVAATAAAVASQTERIINPIVERVAMLEKTSYTGAGKQALADPQMEALTNQVRALANLASTGQGAVTGVKESWGVIVAIAMFGVAVVGAAIGGLVAYLK